VVGKISDREKLCDGGADRISRAVGAAVNLERRRVMAKKKAKAAKKKAKKK